MASAVSNDQTGSPAERSAVLAMISRKEKWLVIRRSRYVRAPGMICFPGGGIEPGETIETALVREIREELCVDITPVRQVWTSYTASGVLLYWWVAKLDPRLTPIPNPSEVQACWWSSLSQIGAHTDMLPSNRTFFDALAGGDVDAFSEQ